MTRDYLEWRARALVPPPPLKPAEEASLEDVLARMGELSTAVLDYLAREDTPHQQTAFKTWSIQVKRRVKSVRLFSLFYISNYVFINNAMAPPQDMMPAASDWTKMVQMQLAKVRAINALGGPRMQVVWSGTCKHLGRLPRYPEDADHILDAERVIEEFLQRADEFGEVLCCDGNGEVEPRVFFLSMFSHRWERPHRNAHMSFPDSASNKKARALAHHGGEGRCPVFKEKRFDYYYWVHAYTHTRQRTRTHACIHTHTHTHAHPLSILSLSPLSPTPCSSLTQHTFCIVSTSANLSRRVHSLRKVTCSTRSNAHTLLMPDMLTRRLRRNVAAKIANTHGAKVIFSNV
jgi:hypothetical protein